MSVATPADQFGQIAAEPGPRVERVEIDGTAYWIKRPERLGLKMRLQKGDPARAFAAEVTAHQAFAARALPVAPVIAASDTYLVTADCGIRLQDLARRATPDFHNALRAATEALALIHTAGLAHGRPSLKDICWQDGRIAFLDLERAGRDHDPARAQAMDLLILIFSIAAETGGDAAAMTCAREAYLAAGGRPLWEQAEARARRYAPLARLAWPLRQMLRRNREWGAVGPFFRFMVG